MVPQMQRNVSQSMRSKLWTLDDLHRKLIPKFNDERPYRVAPKAFIEMLLRRLAEFEIEFYDFRHVASEFFDGDATLWVAINVNDWRSYDDFRRAFQEEYLRPEDALSLLDRISQDRTRPGRRGYVKHFRRYAAERVQLDLSFLPDSLFIDRQSGHYPSHLASLLRFSKTVKEAEAVLSREDNAPVYRAVDGMNSRAYTGPRNADVARRNDNTPAQQTQARLPDGKPRQQTPVRNNPRVAHVAHLAITDGNDESEHDDLDLEQTENTNEVRE